MFYLSDWFLVLYWPTVSVIFLNTTLLFLFVDVYFNQKCFRQKHKALAKNVLKKVFYGLIKLLSWRFGDPYVQESGRLISVCSQETPGQSGRVDTDTLNVPPPTSKPAGSPEVHLT